MEKSEYKILFGINGLENNEAKILIDNLKEYDLTVSSFDCRYKKIGIEKYLSENQDVDIVILSQHLERSSPYSEHDFEMLADNHEEVMIIPILQDGTAGTSVVKELYRLGVYTALYDADADCENLAEIIRNGRSRKDAKIYYKVTEQGDEMSAVDFNSSVAYLEECSPDDLEEHALHVLHMVRPVEFRTILGMLSRDRYNMIAAIRNEEFRTFFLEKKDISVGNSMEKKIKIPDFTSVLDKVTELSGEKKKAWRPVLSKGMKTMGGFIQKVCEKSSEEIRENNREEGISVESMKDVLHNVPIGFVGAGKGSGATHQALLTAVYFQRFGYSVAFLDSTEDSSAFYAMQKWSDVSKQQPGMFSYCGVDFYRENNMRNIGDTIAGLVYNFIIIDYGTASERVFSDMGRCVKRYLVTGILPWERENLENMLKENKINMELFRVVVRGVPESERQKQSWLSNVTDSVLFADVVEDPFSGELYDSLKSEFGIYTGKTNIRSEKKKRVKAKRLQNIKMVGTEVIFVTGLRHGCGATHFSVMLSNFLATKGSVCLITDIQGEVEYRLEKSVYLTDSLDDVKQYAGRQYVVMDCGNLDELTEAELTEFERANRKVIMCWANEDYLAELARVVEDAEDADSWHFVFNNVAGNRIHDVSRIMSSYTSYYLPVFECDSPDKTTKKIAKNICFKVN